MTHAEFQTRASAFIQDTLKLEAFKRFQLLDIKLSQSTESVYALFYDITSSKASCVRISEHQKLREYISMPEILFSSDSSFTTNSNALLHALLFSKGSVEINSKTKFQFNTFNVRKDLTFALGFDGQLYLYKNGKGQPVRRTATVKMVNQLRRLNLIFLSQTILENKARVFRKVDNFTELVSKLMNAFLQHQKYRAERSNHRPNVNLDKMSSQTRPIANMLLVVQINNRLRLVKSNRRVRKQVDVGAKVHVMNTKTGGRISGICMARYCVSRDSARSVSDCLVAVKVYKPAPLLLN